MSGALECGAKHAGLMAEDCYADLPNLAQVKKENLQLKNNKVQVEKDTGICCLCGIHCFRRLKCSVQQCAALNWEGSRLSLE